MTFGIKFTKNWKGYLTATYKICNTADNYMILC
jgi:hypothetical protein